MYFRVEDENGLFPNLRAYGKKSNNKVLDACEVDSHIANEIRDQVNNSNNRSVFSYSKSLAVVLFKYNYVADNPIHLISKNSSNMVFFDVIDEKGETTSICMPYNITNLNYPIKQSYGNKKINLKNYIIDVHNNEQLNKYLRKYTDVGKKKFAACEKDREVIIQHVEDDYIIRDHINVVYLIYALQFKTTFLNCSSVMKDLIEVFCDNVENEIELKALQELVLYLRDFWKFEQESSNKILQQIQQNGREFTSYDIYNAALDIMNGDEIEEVSDNCWYYLHYKMLNDIWGIFFKYNLNCETDNLK